MSLYDDTSLSAPCFQILALFATRPHDADGWITISQSEIATLIHRARNTTSYAIATLETGGYLEIQRRRFDDVTDTQSHLSYRLTAKAKATPDPPPPRLTHWPQIPAAL